MEDIAIVSEGAWMVHFRNELLGTPVEGLYEVLGLHNCHHLYSVWIVVSVVQPPVPSWCPSLPIRTWRVLVRQLHPAPGVEVYPSHNALTMMVQVFIVVVAELIIAHARHYVDPTRGFMWMPLVRLSSQDSMHHALVPHQFPELWTQQSRERAP